MKKINIFALFVLMSFGLINQEIKPISTSYIAGYAGQVLILPVSGGLLYKLYKVDPKAGVSGAMALSSFLVAGACYILDSFSTRPGRDYARVKRQKCLGATHATIIKTGFWVGTISSFATLYFLYKKMHVK